MNRKFFIFMSAIMLLLMFALTGCSGNKEDNIKISGTYVWEDNNKVSLSFSGNSVTIKDRQHDIEAEGTFIMASTTDDEKYMIATFGGDAGGVPSTIGIVNEHRLDVGGYYFVKKSFWENNWWKILIGFVILCIIGALYHKKTGRNLEDDVEKLVDKVADKAGNIKDSNDNNDQT